MPDNESRRRGFLKTAATGILILKPATAFEIGRASCRERV